MTHKEAARAHRGRGVTVTVPTRHGADVAAARKLLRPLRLSIRRDPTPSAERWQAIGEGLMQGDPLADAVAEWMHAHGAVRVRHDFQRCLDDGLDSVPDAPAPLREFISYCERFPDWVEPRRLERGARVVHEFGMASHYALRDVALMGGYQASALNLPLILTGALDGGTQRRIAETMRWVIDCTASDGLARFRDGFKSTLHVRLLHASIRRRLLQAPEWSVAEHGVPINQTDMAATFLGFSVVQLLAVRLLGVPVTPRDAGDVMHLWKTICWLIGIDERWLTDDEQEGRRLLYQIGLAQTPPDDSTRRLGRALMDECLDVTYPFPNRLRARLAQARHLSVTRLFVGRQGMRNLGLPEATLPWYPLLSAPLTLAWHLAHRAVPGGRKRAARIGRAAHEALVTQRFNRGQQPLAALPDG